MKAKENLWDFAFSCDCSLLLWLLRAQHVHSESKCERKSGEVSLHFHYKCKSRAREIAGVSSAISSVRMVSKMVFVLAGSCCCFDVFPAAAGAVVSNSCNGWRSHHSSRKQQLHCLPCLQLQGRPQAQLNREHLGRSRALQAMRGCTADQGRLSQLISALERPGLLERSVQICVQSK